MGGKSPTSTGTSSKQPPDSRPLPTGQVVIVSNILLVPWVVALRRYSTERVCGHVSSTEEGFDLVDWAWVIVVVVVVVYLHGSGSK